MAPIEKAEQLCERYSILGKQLYSFDTCKQCALIAVDEILKIVSSDESAIIVELPYWKQVKNELIQLL